jgi:hypothetical protein
MKIQIPDEAVQTKRGQNLIISVGTARGLFGLDAKLSDTLQFPQLSQDLFTTVRNSEVVCWSKEI